MEFDLYWRPSGLRFHTYAVVDMLQLSSSVSLNPSVHLFFAFVCVCIQVLFWGLRELKRVELFEVSRPLVRMECAGQQLESEEIENFKGHPNFKEMVRYIDVVSFSNWLWLMTLVMATKVHRSAFKECNFTRLTSCFHLSSSCNWSNQELPEQTYLHPPLTIFVVEHRAFGRLALVGSNVVQSLMDYGPPELCDEPQEEDDEPKQRRNGKRIWNVIYTTEGVCHCFFFTLSLTAWIVLTAIRTGCPKILMFSLLASRVLQHTMKTNPLTSMKNIGLSGLTIKNSIIPINPIKLVRVSMSNFLSLSSREDVNPVYNLKRISWCWYLVPQGPLKKLMKKKKELEEEPPETEQLDWWSKYYASLEEIERKVYSVYTVYICDMKNFILNKKLF